MKDFVDQFIKEDDKRKRFGILLIVVALIVFVLLGSFTIVPTGYTGVRQTFGQINETPISSGFAWKIPVCQRIIKINNKQRDVDFEDKVWSETAERTAIYYEGAVVSYSISGEKSAWLCANVNDYNNCVSSVLVASAIKSSSKTFNSEDATNRALIEPAIAESLQKSLDQKYGEGVIYISKVVISNIDFEDSYNEAIAKKQQEQLAYETQQIENKKSVEKAAADAEIARTKAQGEADALLIAAEAEAEANRKIAESLSTALLEKAYYDKWDGKLPSIYGADKNIISVPFGNGN